MAAPLDYASSNASATKPALTPAQRRRRRLIGLALVLCFVPYPTTVFPRLKLRFVDRTGRPADCYHPVYWSGYTNAGSVEGTFRCDPGGVVDLPSQRVWASPASRFLSLLEGFIPHSGGWSGTHAHVSFDVAADESLDGQAMGRPRADNPNPNAMTEYGQPAWAVGRPGDLVHLGPSSSSAVAVIIEFERPGAGSRDVTLVMNMPASATRPAGMVKRD